MMVPDADATAAALVEKVGLLGHPNWRQAFPAHPYVAHFLRTHKSLAVAPTRVEPQGHLDRPNQGDPLFPVFLHSLEEFQGFARPIKTHATVVISKDLDGVIQRLHDRRLPFRVAPVTPEMPFDRLWVGCTPENPHYTPEVDGGLCIEIMGYAPLQMPELVNEVPEPRDAQPADLVRVVSRGYLVRNLDDVLLRLSKNLDWEPSGAVETLEREGYRRARMGFELPHSATLDIIEPTRWGGEATRYLHNYGPGPYYVRLSAQDLDAKAEDLRARGTRFERYDDVESVGGSLLRIDPAELDGLIIEIVQHQPLVRS